MDPEPLVVATKAAWEVFVEETEKSSRTVVVTLSAQSRASLASHFNVEGEEVFGRLVSVFRSWGINNVCDLCLARQISLVESAEEFLRRKSSSSPLICGACPGFITRAESSYSDFILPLLSTAKSPQQVRNA